VAESAPGTASVAHYLRPGTLALGALPPLALYVHLPWCLKKCPYCDFNSHEVAPPRMPLSGAPAEPAPVWRGPPLAAQRLGEATQSRYLDALRCDLEVYNRHLERFNFCF